jgi:hypothetical protein
MRNENKIKFTELSSLELINIDGGWNLLEYIAYGVGVTVGTIKNILEPTQESLTTSHQNGA